MALNHENRSIPPTELRVYSTTSLRKDHSNLLSSLTALINLCYSVAHTTSPHGILLPYSYRRVLNETSFLEEVGKDGFILVLSVQDAEGQEEPIASISAKPFKELGYGEEVYGSEQLIHFKRKAAAPAGASTSPNLIQTKGPENEQSNLASPVHLEDLPKWEIMCNVVHPDYQNRGIAALLFDAVMKEIRRKETRSERVNIVITTMKELNEAYYQKRGFITTQERKFEKGVGGSEVGFTVLEMERSI
ncbi:MAG: hypothetical protein Q9219_003033 [cf. Caloplaca sp. 3 TL-2023]